MCTRFSDAHYHASYIIYVKIIFCIYQILYYKNFFLRERTGGEDIEITNADNLPRDENRNRARSGRGHGSKEGHWVCLFFLVLFLFFLIWEIIQHTSDANRDDRSNRGMVDDDDDDDDGVCVCVCV